MKTRLLKKIGERVRVEENANGMFELRVRNNKKSDWRIVNTFRSIKSAISKKHLYTIMVILRDLGVRGEFVKRRTRLK
jgi:hypothetical protein